LVDCAAWLTCSVADDVVSLAFSVTSSTAELEAASSFCLAGVVVSAEAAIELLPSDASVAPSASGSDCVVASSLAHLF